MKPPRKERLFSVDSTLEFGKHKGERLGDVIIDDTGWVIWATENVEWFKLDEKAMKQLDLAVEIAGEGGYEPDWGDFSDIL